MNKLDYINRLKNLRTRIKSILLESETDNTTKVLEKQKEMLKNYKNLTTEQLKKGADETASVLKEENFQEFLGQAKNGVISTGDAKKANNLNKIMKVANSLYNSYQRNETMHLEGEIIDAARKTANKLRIIGIIYILVGGLLIYFYSGIVWEKFLYYIRQLFHSTNLGEILGNLIMAFLTFQALRFMYGFFIGGIIILVVYAKRIEDIGEAMENSRFYASNTLIVSTAVQKLLKKILVIRFTV